MKRATFSILFVILSVISFAQDKEKTISEETTVSDLKTSFKIETTRDDVFSMILKNFDDKIIRYQVAYKTDRKGRYKEYTIYFKPDDKTIIVSAFKK